MPGFKPSTACARRGDHVIDVVPPLLADARLGPLEHARREQRIEIVAVDPFHLEHADAAALDEVLHVEQIIVLNLGDPRADLGHPLHRFAIAPLIGESLGRKELERDRQREVIGPAALARVDDALPALAEHAPQTQVLGPAQLRLLDQAKIMVEQFIDPVFRRSPPPGVTVRVPCNSVVVKLMLCLVLCSHGELRSPLIPFYLAVKASWPQTAILRASTFVRPGDCANGWGAKNGIPRRSTVNLALLPHRQGTLCR